MTGNIDAAPDRPRDLPRRRPRLRRRRAHPDHRVRRPRRRHRDHGRRRRRRHLAPRQPDRDGPGPGVPHPDEPRRRAHRVAAETKDATTREARLTGLPIAVLAPRASGRPALDAGGRDVREPGLGERNPRERDREKPSPSALVVMWKTLRAPRASGVFQVGVGNPASPPGEWGYPSPSWGTCEPPGERVVHRGVTAVISTARVHPRLRARWCGRDAHTPNGHRTSSRPWTSRKASRPSVQWMSWTGGAALMRPRCRTSR